MPIYEYQCTKCGERFEIISRHGDRDEKSVCPACGNRKTTQVFGGFRVGISRSRLNPGTFERTAGTKPVHKKPRDG